MHSDIEEKCPQKESLSQAIANEIFNTLKTQKGPIKSQKQKEGSLAASIIEDCSVNSN